MDPPETLPRPFLKWAGGKASIVPQLMKVIGFDTLDRIRVYHEPFVGGGALFFALRRFGFKGGAKLSDMNRELITTYNAIASNPERVRRQLAKKQWTREFFEAERAREYALSHEIAGRMIYLNKTCFNGLYRVNRSGKFNVPFGKFKTQPNWIDASNLDAVSKALKRTTIMHEDFGNVQQRAVPGDLVYFDPPYLPASKTADFTSYTKDSFKLEDHERLRDVALRLKMDDVRVVISSSDHPEIRRLYSVRSFNVKTSVRFHLRKVEAPRSISRDGASRAPVLDLIIT